MNDSQLCARCGHDTGAGRPRFAGRERQADGSYLCGDCAHAGRDTRDQADVPVTSPNTNLPNTH